MATQLIENPTQLQDYFRKIENESLIAVDTEFFRETTYFAKLGLVQIAGGEHIACIDVLAFDARPALVTLFTNPDVAKIFHSCSQDMEVLYQYLGTLPTPVLDTQIAAAFLGAADQIGYAGLVEDKLGHLLDKSQTRTNWLQRPLSAQQLEYAADDVRYLVELYQLLLDGLEATSRTEWFLYDCAMLSTSPERFEPEMDTCWKRVRGTQRLSGSQLAIVDKLARWREQLAIDNNLTRRKMLRDELIVDLATTPAETMDALKASGLPRQIIQLYAESLLAAIESGLQTPAEDWPDNSFHRPDAEQKAMLKQLQDIVSQKADSLGIATSMLCSRKELDKLINGQRELNVLQGWRESCIGRELLSALEAY